MKLPVIFSGHGSTFLTSRDSDPTHQALKTLGEKIKSLPIRAVLCISAHYVKDKFSITSSEHPKTIHDHPVESLTAYRYPAMGSKLIAEEIKSYLSLGGINTHVDEARGLDHGAWLVLRAMFPVPSIPVLQLSLKDGFDRLEHFNLGQRLETLRDYGILIVGSGGITHNQNEFRSAYFSNNLEQETPVWSLAFENWVLTTIESKNFLSSGGLLNFDTHPEFSKAHPTSEHFFPLIVCAGASRQDQVTRVYKGYQPGLSTSILMFQGD